MLSNPTVLLAELFSLCHRLKNLSSVTHTNGIKGLPIEHTKFFEVVLFKVQKLVILVVVPCNIALVPCS